MPVAGFMGGGPLTAAVLRRGSLGAARSLSTVASIPSATACLRSSRVGPKAARRYRWAAQRASHGRSAAGFHGAHAAAGSSWSNGGRLGLAMPRPSAGRVRPVDDPGDGAQRK